MKLELSDNQQKEFDEKRREFLNSVFGLLKGLAVHKIENESMERPREIFIESFDSLKSIVGEDGHIEMAHEENLLSVMGHKVAKHFSIVEALRIVPDAMEMAMIEKIRFSPKLSHEEAWKFFATWALHVATHAKPRVLSTDFKNVEVVFIDPEKSNARIKSKSLLMRPSYALGHYYLLKQETEKLFQGVIEGKIDSQKRIRRELLEVLEIGHVNPYQLIAMSLIRPDDRATGLEHAVAEAIANACLCLVLSKNLEFSLKDQLNLGMSGLLYNVGLLSKEMSEIVQTNQSLSQVDYKRVIEGHSGGVLRVLKAQGADRPGIERLLALFEATQAAGKSSISLTLDSRLIRMISAYVALTSDRPYREAYTPYEALKLLGSRATTRSQGGLDPVLYYVFVRFVGVFPVGSLVQLSDQSLAVIYRPSGEKLGHPLVRLCVQDDEEKPQTLDLGLEKNLEVSKSLDPKREGINVAGYFFE